MPSLGIEQLRNYQKENMERVKVESDKIILGEGQSSYQDTLHAFLLGPKDDEGSIGVFRIIEEGADYEVTSGGYLSCAEITGRFGLTGKFFVHSLDPLNLESHLREITKLAGGTIPSKIRIKLDPARADLEGYLRYAKDLVGDSVEIETELL